MYYEASDFWAKDLMIQISLFGQRASEILVSRGDLVHRSENDMGRHYTCVIDFRAQDIMTVLEALKTLDSSQWKGYFGGLEDIALFYVSIKNDVSQAATFNFSAFTYNDVSRQPPRFVRHWSKNVVCHRWQTNKAPTRYLLPDTFGISLPLSPSGMQFFTDGLNSRAR